MIKFFTKYHKWIGLIFTLFILAFAISGIFLNHRSVIAGCDISRKWLPQQYAYKKWNNGAVVGTVKTDSNSVLMYGGSGVWLTDTLCRSPKPYTDGIKTGADHRNIRSIVQMPDSTLFAVTPFCLYKLEKNTEKWVNITQHVDAEDYFSTLYVKADTLIVVSRSHIFTSVYPYTHFEKTEIQAAKNNTGKVSLFRTLWQLHSGELFGLPGKLGVDLLGIATIVLSVTGLIVFFFKIPLKRQRRRHKREDQRLKKTWRFSLRWHNWFGYFLFIPLLIVVVTGMFLRPPLLIPIARAKVQPVPFSTMNSHNPWHDKLRAVRFDNLSEKWVIYTSDGFYSLKHLTDTPEKVIGTPPVSVMGVTVWEIMPAGKWLIGSFSGLYEWDAAQQTVTDALTGKPVAKKRPSGRPTFTNAVSGYSTDFAQGGVVFDYVKGAQIIGQAQHFAPMPATIGENRMSFWHFCLEVHVGRMYASFLRSLTDWFVFLSGVLFLFILVSGYVVYKKKFRKRKVKQ